MSLFTHVLANALMTEATYGDIREAMDKLAKVQRTDREIAERAVDLSNAQQAVLRTLWAAVKESQALAGYAQAALVEAGEHDVAREVAQEWAAIIDRVYVAICPPDRLN